MKSRKLIILEKLLKVMAKAVLDRHKPKIVGITGSVGKTSTKTAVHAVLSSSFYVRENQKNYNNEIGIPLTIIGAETGGKNIFKWLWVFIKWMITIISPKYPEILILELGVDRPGDMSYFMSFIKPTIGIVTNISSSHIEFFGAIDNIAKEKGVLIESVKENGFAILNGDDERALKMRERTKARVMTYGQKNKGNVNATDVIFNYEGEVPRGISFKLDYEGNIIPVRLKNILATHQVYAALAAISVGTVFKMNLINIATALESLRSPQGRMTLIEGVNGSYIIDDTYNASPVSTVAALDVFSQIKAKRKIAILGDMLELGDQTKNGHREVGEKVFSVGVDLFVALGDRMESAEEELVSLGFSSAKIMKFDDPNVAGEKIASKLSEGDLILVKGSQGMRMEKVVEKLLRNPGDAKKLLCRQTSEWKKRPFVKP